MACYSYSIVPGGLEVTSYPTRLMQGVLEGVGVRRHAAGRGDGAERERVLERCGRRPSRPRVANRQQHRKRLPDVVVQSGLADLLEPDRVGAGTRCPGTADVFARLRGRCRFSRRGPASPSSPAPEPLRSSLPCLHRLFLPVARRCACLQPVDETARHVEHVLDRVAKGCLVSPRRCIEAAQFAYELK